MASLYGFPDSISQKVVAELETWPLPVAKEDSVMMKLYRLLKKENLLYLPSIQIKTLDSNILTVYLDSNVYSQIAPVRYMDLASRHKNIRLKFEAVQLFDSYYHGSKMLALDTITAELPIRQGKFKIEDYELK